MSNEYRIREKENSPLDGVLLATQLPPPKAKRWSAQRKAEVVAAVQDGTLSLDEARGRYELTEEEFASWQETLNRHGTAGLRAKALEERRKIPRRPLHEPGEAVLDASASASCTIIDISPRGARLDFPAPVDLPTKFQLRCIRSGRSIPVRTAWQRGLEVGACFDTSLAAPWALEAGLDAWLLGQS